MLVEVKVKVARIIDGKTRKRTETYLMDDELFAKAEYAVTASLTEEQNNGLVDEFEIQSLRISPLKEVATQFSGNETYVATLKDIWLTEDGTEKALRYKVLLWADDLAEAQRNAQTLSREGYDMLIEGIKQTDYEFIAPSNQDKSV